MEFIMLQAMPIVKVIIKTRKKGKLVLVSRVAAMTPSILTKVPAERSIPPEERTPVIPIAKTQLAETCRNILRILVGLRKYSDIATHIRTIRTRIINVLADRSVANTFVLSTLLFVFIIIPFWAN